MPEKPCLFEGSGKPRASTHGTARGSALDTLGVVTRL
jgi:hypothetical protein